VAPKTTTSISLMKGSKIGVRTAFALMTKYVDNVEHTFVAHKDQFRKNQRRQPAGKEDHAAFWLSKVRTRTTENPSRNLLRNFEHKATWLIIEP
jgi:hypothetical protein